MPEFCSPLTPTPAESRIRSAILGKPAVGDGGGSRWWEPSRARWASGDVVFDGTNVRFTFGIPCGGDGSTGNDGATGADGPQDPSGEVNSSDLANAISGTSNNINGIPTLDAPYGDPHAEALRRRLNEQIIALRF